MPPQQAYSNIYKTHIYINNTIIDSKHFVAVQLTFLFNHKSLTE